MGKEVSELLRGVDVSKWQQPATTPYALLSRNGYSFVIARVAYGDRPDATFDDHVLRARSNGLAAGGYLFWRHEQDPEAQARAFRDTVSALDYGPGWIVPALDLEWQLTGGKATAASMAPSKRTAEMLREWYGDCLIYTTASFWTEIGKPEWWLDYPLWVAHYGVTETNVRTPGGKPWTIWQHASKPIDGLYAAAIDQNVARALPLVTQANSELRFDDTTERFIPAVGGSGGAGDAPGDADPGVPGPGGGSVSGSAGAGSADPDAVAHQDEEAGLEAREVTPGDRVANYALSVLEFGPMSRTIRASDYRAFIDANFDDSPSAPVYATTGTNCAIFARGCLIAAGLKPRGKRPKVTAITTWLGVGWFGAEPSWIPNDGSLTPKRGDLLYWCGGTEKTWPNATNGHVGVLVDGSGWGWVVAEGGGTNGLCRLSAPKDIRASVGRPLRGVWRPALMVAPAAKPTAPPTPAPLAKTTQDPIREWQAALAGAGYDVGTVDGKFGPKTLAASLAALLGAR
jgi:lysozyme